MRSLLTVITTKHGKAAVIACRIITNHRKAAVIANRITTKHGKDAVIANRITTKHGKAAVIANTRVSPRHTHPARRYDRHRHHTPTYAADTG